MKLTKADKKEFVKILKEAKKFLWNGKSKIPNNKDKTRYVCIAISLARQDTGEYMLRQLISQRINQYATVFGWLEKEYGIVAKNQKERQAYRHAWVDNMIKEFSR
jgi:hypothetical protein